MQLTFENQLFEYIHCFTEINVNLLLNTSNFHRKFRIIFSLILSENAPNMDVREATFQNFPGEHARTPPVYSLAPLALDSILAGPTLNCFRRACLYCWHIGWSLHLGYGFNLLRIWLQTIFRQHMASKRNFLAFELKLVFVQLDVLGTAAILEPFQVLAAVVLRFLLDR